MTNDELIAIHKEDPELLKIMKKSLLAMYLEANETVGDIVIKQVFEYLKSETKENDKVKLDMAFELLETDVPYAGIANDIKTSVMNYINFKEKN